MHARYAAAVNACKVRGGCIYMQGTRRLYMHAEFAAAVYSCRVCVMMHLGCLLRWHTGPGRCAYCSASCPSNCMPGMNSIVLSCTAGDVSKLHLAVHLVCEFAVSTPFYTSLTQQGKAGAAGAAGPGAAGAAGPASSKSPAGDGSVSGRGSSSGASPAAALQSHMLHPPLAPRLLFCCQLLRRLMREHVQLQPAGGLAESGAGGAWPEKQGRAASAPCGPEGPCSPQLTPWPPPASAVAPARDTASSSMHDHVFLWLDSRTDKFGGGSSSLGGQQVQQAGGVGDAGMEVLAQYRRQVGGGGGGTCIVPCSHTAASAVSPAHTQEHLQCPLVCPPTHPPTRLTG